VNQSLIARGSAGAHFATRAAAEDLSESCLPLDPSLDPYRTCTRGVGSAAGPAGKREVVERASGLSCKAEGRVCFPRNSWRCLVIHWLQQAFPGQVKMRTSAKPLLFMASCFAGALSHVDLVVHEYAVNGGGRMLCLQERVLRAALQAARAPAVLMLLWIPKHFQPAPPRTMLTEVQSNLAALGRHYRLPTLHMQRAFSAPCAHHAPGAGNPRPDAWCYKRSAALGGEEGLLHGDMYHPNVDGHAFFAAHIIELLERSAVHAAAVAAAAAADAAAASAPSSSESLAAALRAVALTPALHELNRGLDSSGEGGANLCLGVELMARLATTNRGWALSEEENSAGVKRLPALQANEQGSEIRWPLDLRGIAWVAITYMQSYAGFAVADVACAGGCACKLHTGKQLSADVDSTDLEDTTAASASSAAAVPGAIDGAAFQNVVNATSARTKTSEPQWKIFDVVQAASAEACELVVRTVSPGKFKLLLVSLIRVAAADDRHAASVVRASTVGTKGSSALACFGVHDSVAGTKHGHGMVSVSSAITLDTLSLDDSRYWTRQGYKKPRRAR
jgi:hypothetical protein